MTRGSSNKPKTLGRLIFGDKRKQHASPSRHRSASRNPSNGADVSSHSGRHGGVTSKSPINVHDWAVWRMQLNEHLANGTADRIDPKHMRQYLQSNQFYQQHSRDPSNGRFNGTRLLFSIPHAKLKPDYVDHIQGKGHGNSSKDVSDVVSYNQIGPASIHDDRKMMDGYPISTTAPIIHEKPFTPVVPKDSYAKTDEFIRVNEQMIANDASRVRNTARNSYCAADRVHSTLQKAVKDGNVLEKIKAFEMQAAAAQAESATKVPGNPHSNRVQPISSPTLLSNGRALSPLGRSLISNPISPPPNLTPPMQQLSNVRSPRGRHIHPMGTHRREGYSVPATQLDTRKGVHVLEPAHGDIILKRRTPSQTGNDEDYSTTIMSSVAQTMSYNHHRSTSRSHHHQPFYQQQTQQRRRTSTSRSRARYEPMNERRPTGHKERSHQKSQSKKKESNTSAEPGSTTKTSSRYRWLKGRKETPTESKDEDVKQETSTNSKKNSKNKKKQVEENKGESTKKSIKSSSKEKALSADNNRVYGVPQVCASEEMKTEDFSETPTMDNNEITTAENLDEVHEEKNIYMTPQEEENHAKTSEESMTSNKVERRTMKPKNGSGKLSSTDGEILDKIDEDARFSRPTDDHAHRSDLIDDDDDQSKSDGDVFFEESSLKSTNNMACSSTHSSNAPSSNSKQQGSTEKSPSERRWHWSKESGGLIDKGNRKKSSSSSAIPANESIPEENHHEHHDEGEGEDIRSSDLAGKPLSPSDRSQKINEEQVITSIAVDEFFENGPHTNPEEALAKLNQSA